MYLPEGLEDTPCNPKRILESTNPENILGK